MGLVNKGLLTMLTFKVVPRSWTVSYDLGSFYLQIKNQSQSSLE